MTTQTAPQGQLAIRIVAMPADTNGNGDIFGGWLVSHMDLAGSAESIQRASSRIVTVAIDAMTFLKPVYVGDVVSCYTQLLKIGRTSMQYKIEVWTLTPLKSEDVKVAEGTFTYVAIDDEGKPHPVSR